MAGWELEDAKTICKKLYDEIICWNSLRLTFVLVEKTKDIVGDCPSSRRENGRLVDHLNYRLDGVEAVRHGG